MPTRRSWLRGQGGGYISAAVDDILGDAHILQVEICPFYLGEGIEGTHEARIDFGLMAEASSAGDEFWLFGGFIFEVIEMALEI
jgi:hypothetical protein